MPRDHVEQYSLGAASEFRRQTAAEHTPLEDGAVQLYADSRDGQAPFLAEMTGRDREGLIDQLWSAIEALPDPEPRGDRGRGKTHLQSTAGRPP